MALRSDNFDYLRAVYGTRQRIVSYSKAIGEFTMVQSGRVVSTIRIST
jgi:hypothetical protein